MSTALSRADQPLFVGLAVQLLEAGISVRFRAGGTSMRPAIDDGDVLTVAPDDPARITAGDIILYRQSGRPIVHRVARVTIGDNGVRAFVTRGDGKAADDAPIGADQVLGRVVAVEGARRSTGAFARLVSRLRRRLAVDHRGCRRHRENS